MIEQTSAARDTREGQQLLLSVPQAAWLLGVGETLCWELVHSGQLETIRLGRRVLVPRAALEKMAVGERE